MNSEEITKKNPNSENSKQSICLNKTQTFPIQHLKINYSLVFIKKKLLYFENNL